MVKANYACDLHCHTNRSDGVDTPRELIDNAAACGVKILAITDHDVIPPANVTLEDGRTEMESCEYAASKGIRLLCGIEVSCETEVEDVHIVCFGCDWNDPYFEQLQSEVVHSKIESYAEVVRRLREDGNDISWEEVLQNNGNPIKEEQVQKKMIFELMARKGITKDWSEAKLLVKNTERYQIKRLKPNPQKVIEEVHRCGGYAIMAHPFLVNDPIFVKGNKMNRETYIEGLIKSGLDGIEACYTYDKTSYNGDLSKQEIEDYIRNTYSNRLLIISGGSDYHADHKKGVKNARGIGECGITEEYFMANPILRKLLRTV